MANRHRARDVQIGVTAFKSRCLSLIDDVAAGRKSRVVLTKRGKPVAALVPLSGKSAHRRDLWGALRGTVKIPKGVDLTKPTGESWNAAVVVAAEERERKTKRVGTLAEFFAASPLRHSGPALRRRKERARKTAL